jgi:membrane-bound lytic murein transglycosylase D
MKILVACLFLLLLSGCNLIHSNQLVSPEPQDSADKGSLLLDQQSSRPLEQPPITGAVLALDSPADLPIDTPIQPAPVADTPADPVEDPELWVRVRQGFQLDHELDRNRVKSQLRWYSSNQQYLNRVVTRANRYLFYVLGEIEARNLPTELALLPIVESAYDPFAYSHGRAMGMWQFIPATGRLYGLSQDWWYDGRRDIQASTNAALDYLERLYKVFGQDWQLALAAYNSGEGNVRSAIRKNRSRGKPTDFWSLKLPDETRAYVPKLLAISSLVDNPDQNNIVLNPIPDTPYWVQADIGSQIDLSQAARLAEITLEELYLLNPGFNQWSTHPKGPYHLLIPVDQEQTFYANLDQLADADRVGWQRHKIKSGESLGFLAAKYHTTIQTIRQVNGIKGNMIRTGDSLLIPVALSSPDQYVLSSEERLKSTQENLESRYGHSGHAYKVQNGDSLWTISRKFNVNLRALAKWNGMATTDVLYPGTVLKIFTVKEITARNQPVSYQIPGAIRKLNYKVRSGESLSLIASKFNVTVSKIKDWNGELAGKKYIQPGQKLTLYVDVTKVKI